MRIKGSWTFMTEAAAKVLRGWHYEPPYDVYDCPSWERLTEYGGDLADPVKRAQEYMVFREPGRMIAFGRIYEADPYVMIGIGLKPELCGQGLGKPLLERLVRKAQERYPERPVALEVRRFNVRAIRCYEQAGFIETRQYERKTPEGMVPYVLMTLGT